MADGSQNPKGSKRLLQEGGEMMADNNFENDFKNVTNTLDRVIDLEYRVKSIEDYCQEVNDSLIYVLKSVKLLAVAYAMLEDTINYNSNLLSKKLKIKCKNIDVGIKFQEGKEENPNDEYRNH